ncbi:ATP-binding protein [Brachyspira intermedia]|uniref:AAA family ATPase n=1 Tax=Brachyspira intermedia TaxID=84377 RepID=UPI00261356DA|nr:ATP-binding protein [uncultured Brachyspira sp.]
MSDIQIPNISISNFKCFKEFSIDSFKRFNLIFGKNSVGKSNLLEALYLYSNMFRSDTILSSFLQRDIPLNNNLELIFHNFDYTNPINIKTNKRELNIYPIKSLTNSLLDGIYYQVENNNGETIKLPMLINNNRHLDNSFVPINNTFIFDNKKILSSIINAALFNFSFLNDYSTSETKVKNETIGAFNRLQNLKIDKTVVESLKAIIPNIESIRISSDKVCEADIGLDRYLPINALGSGILKIFNYIVNASFLPNGVLFIDEIDNGFHYSSLRNLWLSLFKVSYLGNIQIFATTHSYECIKAFNDVYNEVKNEYNSNDDIQGIRIEADKKEKYKYKAIIYNNEELNNAMDNWEVR